METEPSVPSPLKKLSFDTGPLKNTEKSISIPFSVCPKFAWFLNVSQDISDRIVYI